MDISRVPVLSSDRDVFTTEYHVTHPGGDKQVAEKLYKVVQRIHQEYEITSDGCDNFHIQVSSDSLVPLFEELKMYWLFHGVPFTESFRQLQSFVINKNDPNLVDADYVLLFYAFLLGEEVQDATRDVPLSILYDMFLPIAEDNLNKWNLLS
jgi:hypothetical protein